MMFSLAVNQSNEISDVIAAYLVLLYGVNHTPLHPGLAHEILAKEKTRRHRTDDFLQNRRVVGESSSKWLSGNIRLIENIIELTPAKVRFQFQPSSKDFVCGFLLLQKFCSLEGSYVPEGLLAEHHALLRAASNCLAYRSGCPVK